MSALDPRAQALRLWKIHGGDQHGPHIETLSMPLDRFDGFVDALSAALSQPQPGEPVAWRTPFFENNRDGKLVPIIVSVESAATPDDGWEPLYTSPQPALAVKGLTKADLAEALECVWNAALGASHQRQEGITIASIIAESAQAMATRLRELDASPPHSGEVELLRELRGLFDAKGYLFCSGDYQIEVIAKVDAALSIAPATADGWRLVPEDLVTHLGDFLSACMEAKASADDNSPVGHDSDDAKYWQHQIDVIHRVQARLPAAPTVTGGR